MDWDFKSKYQHYPKIKTRKLYVNSGGSLTKSPTGTTDCCVLKANGFSWKMCGGDKRNIYVGGGMVSLLLWKIEKWSSVGKHYIIKLSVPSIQFTTDEIVTS